MTSNMEKWGREAARKRYGSSGPNMVKARAEGGRAEDDDKATADYSDYMKKAPPDLPARGAVDRLTGGPQSKGSVPRNYEGIPDEDRESIKKLLGDE